MLDIMMQIDVVSQCSSSITESSCTKSASLGTTVFVECFPVAGEKVLSHYSITVNRCLYLIMSVNVGFYFGVKC